MRKVIFLDIDGVLNRMGSNQDLILGVVEKDIMNIYLKLVNNGYETIITSSRRFYEDERNLLEKVFGMFNIKISYIDLNIRFRKRADEVKKYLDVHPDITNYIILDDNDFNYSLDEELAKHFILVKGTDGLAEEDIRKIL